jgi:flotillin
MLEHIEALSATAAQAISNIKFDKVIVWENGGGDGKGATANFLQNMAKTLPPVLQIMENIGGVKMPEYFGKVVDSGLEGRAGAAKAPASSSLTPNGDGAVH